MKRWLIILILCSPCFGAVGMGFIGDSITNGLASNPHLDPAAQVAAQLTATIGQTFASSNHGVIGATSTDWVPGNTFDLSNAITDFQALGNIQYIMIMLGTNDCKDAIQTPPATYKSNLQAVIAALKAAGFTSTKYVLNFQPYVAQSGGEWTPSVCNPLLNQYQAKLFEIAAADPTHVFVGDQAAWLFFQANQNLLEDGVHPTGAGTPTNGGYLALISLWTQAVERLSIPANLSSGVIDPERAVDWSQSGFPGSTIPSDSWTQCGATIAAYGSSGTPASSVTIVNAVKHTAAGYTSCGANTYVLLGVGTFHLSNGALLQGINSNELRGSGSTQTILKFYGSSTGGHGLGSGFVMIDSTDGTYPGGVSTAFNWTAGYTQGATQITVASSVGVVANQTVVVADQCDDGYTGVPCTGSAVETVDYFNCQDAYVPGPPTTGCSFNASVGAARAHRGQEEMFEVTACSPSCNSGSSTVLTISPPIAHPNWRSGQSPQIWLLQPSRNVGIRDLTIDGSAVTNVNNVTWCLEFFDTTKAWAYNVRLLGCANTSLYGFLINRTVWSSNYIWQSGQDNPATDNSGMNLFGSNNVVVNNICHDGHLCYIMNGPGTGNVIGYNYMVNGFTGNSIMFGMLWYGHSNGADYNLYEGNVATNVFGDQPHGTHLMNTFNRNFLTGWESCGNGGKCGTDPAKTDLLEALSPLGFNRYMNAIGNVLGTPGITTTAYEFVNNMYYTSSGNAYPWNIGSGNSANPGGGFAGGPIPIDPKVATTSMRWGNWDAFNNATRWVTSEVPSGISLYPNAVPTTTCTSVIDCPASFFLSARPSWWKSTTPFPAIGPDVSSGNIGKINGTINRAAHYSGMPGMLSVTYAGDAVSDSWVGHVNAIPAMDCYLNTLSGPPDGTGSALPFDATTCYAAASQTVVNIQGKIVVTGNATAK